jgi:hypothetical protein
MLNEIQIEESSLRCDHNMLTLLMFVAIQKNTTKDDSLNDTGTCVGQHDRTTNKSFVSVMRDKVESSSPDSRDHLST